MPQRVTRIYYFWTIKTSVVRPGEVAVMFIVPLFALPIFRTVNAPVRLPPPVIAGDPLTVYLLVSLLTIVTVAGPDTTLPNPSTMSNAAVRLPPFPSGTGPTHDVELLSLFKQFTNCIAEAAAGLMTMLPLAPVTPLVAVSV